MASKSPRRSDEGMWKRIQEIHSRPIDASDVSNLEMANAVLELKLARKALHDVIQWIENVPESDASETFREVQKAKESLSSFGISGSHSVRMPSPTGKRSPRSRWSKTKSIMSATIGGLRSRRASAAKKWDGQGQGQGQGVGVEMKSLESKNSTTGGATKSSGHDEAKLPPELEEFQPLGEISFVSKCCAKLRAKQDEFSAEITTSKPSKERLVKLKSQLVAIVKELKGHMLKGIQQYLYEENIDDHLKNVVDAGNRFFLDVYSSVFHLIENTEAVEMQNYSQAIVRARAVIPAGSKPKQTTSDPVELICHAYEVQPKYEAIVRDLVKTMEKNGTIHPGDIKLTIAKVKKLQRIVEKSMLKATVPGDASRTCDLVRGMAVCNNMTTIKKFVDALTDLCKKKKITRIRLKDRFKMASDGGWRDFMDNFIVAGDKHRHICELQVVHRNMIVARKGLPGHVVYGKVRNAAELSVLYNGGNSKYNFNELLWQGKQQAALAMLFIKCNGQHWNAAQKKGWCTSPDLGTWAGVDLDKNGMVTSLDLSRRKLEGHDGLRIEMLRPLTELRSISLRESSRHIRTDTSDDYESLGDDDITVIAKACPKLRVADFDFCSKITDDGITTLGRLCPDLNILELQECDLITDAGVQALVGSCKNLTRLNLKECDKLSDGALGFIGGLSKLEELDVQDCDLISNRGLQSLDNLKMLNLNYCSEITDKGLSTIASKSPALEHISLTELQVTDQGVRELVTKCTKLKSICLYQCRRIGDTAVAAVAKFCPQLEVIDLQYCSRITDNSLKLIGSNCTNLREVRIRNCEKVSDAFLEVLVSNCKQIKRVDCFGCPSITDAGIKAAKSALPSISVER